METEKISIVVPVYNVEAYLRQCLDSILNQHYKNLEIIIVNDGSPDNCQTIIDEYAKSDSRIIPIYQENGGLSAARNKGMQFATGKYLVFIDSDDWIEKDFISLLIKDISDDVGIVACSYSREFVKKSLPRDLKLNGLVPKVMFKRRLLGLVKGDLEDPSQADSIVTANMKLYLTRIIKENDLKFISTKEIGTEDLLFNVAYVSSLSEDSKALVINRPLYKYRRTNVTSLTATYKPNLYNQWLKMFAYISDYVKEAEEREAFKNRICLSIIGLGLNELQNPKGKTEQVANLDRYLSSTLYIEAYKDLPLQYFPLHWKLFFYFAKKRHTSCLLLMLKLIRFMINRNN